MKKVYLDNAATTQVDKKVFNAMKPYFMEKYGNASEPHSWGRKAKVGIENARKIIADFLGAKPYEIVFTSCSTESINLAHKGLIESITSPYEKPHIITTQIEHKAVLETCKHLNAEVTYVPVDKYGMVKVKDIEEAIKPNTVLVSVMYVNNEVGTIQPIKEIGDMLTRLNHITHSPIYFHVDATQAIQYLDCNVDHLGVDLLSFTGHKIHAPKGIGALYVRYGTPMSRQQDGGGQEFGLRAGTENVPYIVGLGKAIEMIDFSHNDKITELRNILIDSMAQVPNVILTGHLTQRVPHIASFAFKDLNGEDIVNLLSEKGIASASGSACTASSIEVSHVLDAMDLEEEWIKGSLRLSLSRYTTREEIDFVVKNLLTILNKLGLIKERK
jgi:cysteine desulfurase